MKTKRNNRQPKITATDKRRPVTQASQPVVQPLTHHIHELRRRLFWAVLLLITVGTGFYMYRDFFMKLVMRPLGDEKLIYLSPAGGFNFIFTVTLYLTLMVVLPFILYQFYAFVRPAIPRHTGRSSLTVGVVATLLMAGGVVFGYTYAVPAGLDFLMQFADEYVTASLTAESYLNFVLAYVFGIGVLFEVPLLLMFLHWIHPLTPKGLLKSERYAILAAFVIGGVISPSPDALSQAIIAVPIIILYQCGVIAILLSIYKQRKTQTQRKAETKTPQSLVASKPAVLSKFLHAAPVFQKVHYSSRHQPIVHLDVKLSSPGQTPSTRRSVDGIMVKRPRPEARPQSLTASVRPLHITPRLTALNDYGVRRAAVIDVVR